MSPSLPLLNRRQLLKLAAVAGAATACRPWLRAQARGPGAEPILRYFETLARADGGYGWGNQEISHLTPTFAVIGGYRLLQRTPPRAEVLTQYVRRGHPREIKKLEQERRIFDFQQVQALAWLGADAAELAPRIAAITKPLAYLKQYERHGYPVFQSELGVVRSHALLGLPLAGIVATFGPYLDERRRTNGSYNNTPARDGGDGHVMNTLGALQAGRDLGRKVEARTELIAWLQRCQLPGGGFTHAPGAELGGVDDIAYTRAALRALQLLGAGPADRAAAVAYVQSLANADGGFADRAGWLSNPLATYSALDALDAMGALDTLDTLRRRPRPAKVSLPSGLKVYSIQIEAHGQGSPADAVELARSLKIDCWGAKNAKPEWLVRARALAVAQRVGVNFFVANEEYGTWVDVPGMGTYSHTSDLFAPGNTEIGPSLAGPVASSWPEFQAKRVVPLEQGQGRLFWQFGENEELVRLLLDDSLERGGFAAISTFHFGNPDFTNTEPFLHRWRGRIPFIALQDAHGPEPWWFADQTTGFRTLFLATEPTWAAWLHALKQNWVAAVRRDVWTKGRTWLHSGSDEVAQFVREREQDWRWWDNPAITRPMVSIVPVRAEDAFEAGRPESGLALRVRCAWENTAQGLPKAPLAELAKLSVDGRFVTPELVTRKRANGQGEDHFHRWLMQSAAPGQHQATATVRVLATGREVTRTIEFAG
jgi:hypothetical protein